MAEQTLSDVVKRLDVLDCHLATIDLELRALRAVMTVLDTRLRLALGDHGTQEPR